MVDQRHQNQQIKSGKYNSWGVALGGGGYVGSRDLAGSVAPFSQCDLHFPVGWLSLFTTLELYLWELEKYINMHKAYKARKSDESTTAQPHVYHNIHAVK